MAKPPTEIRSLARSYTHTALKVLAGIMQADDAPHAARASCAQYILDRGWGKAMVSVEVSGEIASKVIRAPNVTETAAAWTQQHVPDHVTEH